MKRRAQGADAGDTTDEQSIDAVAPKSDILLVNKEGDGDGRFTNIAKAKNIPLILVEKNLDLVKECEKLFKREKANSYPSADSPRPKQRKPPAVLVRYF